MNFEKVVNLNCDFQPCIVRQIGCTWKPRANVICRVRKEENCFFKIKKEKTFPTAVLFLKSFFHTFQNTHLYRYRVFYYSLLLSHCPSLGLTYKRPCTLVAAATAMVLAIFNRTRYLVRKSPECGWREHATSKEEK